jgi:DNA repair exonuclease SbcCD ATPase subunit
MEQIKSNLQLQTQVKVSEVVANEKTKAIAALNQQITENQVGEGKNVDEWKRKYEAAEANYNATMNKLAHMDNLLKQVGDMKQIIMAKDGDLAKAKSELETIKSEFETTKSELAKLSEILSSKEAEIKELKAEKTKAKVSKKLINKVESLSIDSAPKETLSLDDF